MAEGCEELSGREEVLADVRTLFTAVADIFHCWFSSPVSSACGVHVLIMIVSIHVRTYIACACIRPCTCI